MIGWLEKKGFFHLLSANFLTQFLQFGSTLLVAKLLSRVELGEIRILQSYASLFVVIAGFGFNAAVLKSCSENREDSDRLSILRLALCRAAITVGAVLCIVAVLCLTGIVSSSRHLSLWLLVYCLMIPFAVTTDILCNFLQALKRIKQMARAQALIRAQSFVIIVLSTWRWGFKGFVFATIAAYIAGMVRVLWQVGIKFLRVPKMPAPAAFFHIALFSVLANGVATLGQYADMFVLDHFSKDRAEIGCYGLATMFVIAASQITATVQAITVPYFTENAGDEVWFGRQLMKNQIRLVALSVLVAAVLFGVAAVLIPVIYGPTYASTLVYLAILLLRYVVISACAMMGVALFGLGFVRYSFIAVAVSTPVGLLLSYFLLRRLGISGVAWAQVLASLANLAMVTVLLRLALRRSYHSSEERKGDA